MSTETLLTIVQMQIRQTLVSRDLGKQLLVGSCVAQRQRRTSPDLCTFTRRAVPPVLGEQTGYKTLYPPTRPPFYREQSERLCIKPRV